MKNNSNKKGYVSDIKNTTLWIAVTLIFILIINIILSFYVQNEMISNIISNIIGVLIPIILIDLFYEFMTKKYSYYETSRVITETLMGNEEIIKGFSEAVRKNFVFVTISTMLTERKGKILKDVINTYINDEIDIRTFFDYDINYLDCEGRLVNDLKSINDYHLVVESLKMKKAYSEPKYSEKDVKVIFVKDGSSLENAFKDNMVLYREVFDITDEDMEILIDKCNKEKFFAIDFFALRVSIDGIAIEEFSVKFIEIEGKVVGVSFSFRHPKMIINELSEYAVDYKIVSRILCKKRNNYFIAVLSQPTYMPTIRFSFNSKIMKNVKILPFFDSNYDAYEDNNPSDNVLPFIKIAFTDWVLPRSGAVFIWDNIE